MHAIMAQYNLIKYSNNYSKSSGNLWQYYRDEPVLADAGAIASFSAANNRFKFKHKITGKRNKMCHKKCWNNATIKISD